MRLIRIINSTFLSLKIVVDTLIGVGNAKHQTSSFSYKTNRFDVAVRLFSNRLQKTSKCGKNISDTLGYRLVCHIFVLSTF